MPEDNKQLHVFANEVVDWVVAYNPEDAVKVWEETVNQTYLPEEDGGEFEQLPDDKEMEIYQEETIEPRGIPVGAVLVKKGEHSHVYRASLRAWADVSGRCFLASSEW